MKMTAKQLKAIHALEPLDGVETIDMPVVAICRIPSRYDLYCDRGSQPSAYCYRVDLRHPMHGVISAYIERGVAAWPYLGHLCEVNGVVYASLAEARRVREALAAAGIPDVHPSCKAARAALANH